jgi:hypothetical protein
MFALPIQAWSIVLEITNVCAIILIKQDEDDTDREIRENESEDLTKSTMTSDIEEDDFGRQQEFLHLDQVRHDKPIRTTRVPLTKKQSRVGTLIGCT